MAVLEVYIASRNDHKVEEFRNLLAPYGVQVRSLPEGLGEAPETGETFEENAIQKAVYYGRQVSGWVVADDSGICVDALHGAPGVHSARFSGEHGNDMANNQKLLSLLQGVPWEARTAQFECVLAAWHSSLSEPVIAKGTVRGHVAFEVDGHAGFGYDSVFCVAELDKTFASLTSAEKNLISHRREAVRKLMAVWGG